MPKLFLPLGVKYFAARLRNEGYDFSLLGKGIDQTMRGALAQIDVLIRKELPETDEPAPSLG